MSFTRHHLVAMTVAGLAGLAAGVWLDRQWLDREPMADRVESPGLVDLAQPEAPVAETPPPARSGANREFAGRRRSIPLDPASAFAAAMAESDPGRRAQALQRLAASIDPASIPQLLALADRMPAGQLRSEFIQHLLNSAGRQPGNAPMGPMLAWAQQLPAGEHKQRALGAILGQWARSDAAGALAYAQGLPPGGATGTLLSGLAQGWAQSDPAAAAAWASSLPFSQARDSALQNIVSRWAQSDPAAAAAFAEGLPTGRVKNNALGTVADRWA